MRHFQKDKKFVVGQRMWDSTFNIYGGPGIPSGYQVENSLQELPVGLGIPRSNRTLTAATNADSRGGRAGKVLKLPTLTDTTQFSGIGGAFWGSA